MAEKRDKIVCFKLKESELEALKNFAEKENKRVSDFVRDTINNKIKRG